MVSAAVMDRRREEKEEGKWPAVCDVFFVVAGPLGDRTFAVVLMLIKCEIGDAPGRREGGEACCVQSRAA